jgi:hypothetical protein
VGLVTSGATLFGTFYIMSVLGAAIASDVCAEDAALGCRDALWPLYIPVAGPFIQMGYISGSGANTGRALLAIDGALQATGVALMIAGLVATAVPRPAAAVYGKRLLLTPALGPRSSGLALVGRF